MEFKNFAEELEWRNYIHQCTDLESLKNISVEKNIVFYVGFDCTAKSLHVGNLLQIMLIRTLQKYGHKPIVIVGGATTKIGDPTGRDDMRKILSDSQLQENIDGIKKSLSKFISFGTKDSDAILLDNSSWLESIKYMDFLKNFGKDFSVNRMLSMDSVKSRLDRDQPMTFLEFNYMLLQAYDFMHLSETYNCTLQLGGSDQWGNIVMGVDLIRRKLSKQSFGLTTPLITTSSGAKMGKSASGAVWINEDILSPYEYFQFWRNIEDNDVIRFSKFYAEFSLEEQENFEKLANESINEAKKLLAKRLCSLCHGNDSSEEAFQTSIKVFEEGSMDENLPKIEIKKEIFDKPLPVFDLFFISTICSSKSESKRLIQGGGARINNIKIDDENMIIDSSYIKEGYIKLSSGKKKHILLEIV